MSGSCYTFDPLVAGFMGAGLVILLCVVPMSVYHKRHRATQVAPIEPISAVRRPMGAEMNTILGLARGMGRTLKAHLVMIEAQAQQLLSISAMMRINQTDSAQPLVINVRHQLNNSHTALMNVQTGADLICSNARRLIGAESHASNASEQA